MMRFRSTFLGRISPHVGGVKVYRRESTASRNEIILDAEVSWASECDLAVGCAAAVPRCAALERLFLHGTVRLTLGPLLKESPLVGGIAMAFVTAPRLDFDLGGLANVVDMPGISKLVKSLILEQIGNLAVIPNQIRVPFIDQTSSDKNREVSIKFGKNFHTVFT